MTERRVALITGGSGGIGTAVAAALAAAGCPVAVGYRSGAEAATAVVDAIVASGGEAAAVAIDVTDPAAVDEAVSPSKIRLMLVMPPFRRCEMRVA